MTKKTLPEPVEALILTLMVFTGIVLLALTMGSAVSSVSAEGELETLITIFYLYSKSLFIIVHFYYAQKKGYTLNKLFRFSPVSGQTIFLAIILAVSLFIITDEIDRLISTLIPPPDAIKEMMKPLQINTVLQWIFIIVGSVFVAAISEESLFRGFLQVTLENKGDPTRAIILTSVTWAIVHLNPYWAIPVFVLGVFIGFVAWKTKSIWPAVTIHASYNFLSLLIGNEAIMDNMSWYTMGNHISPVVLVFAFAGVYYGIKNLDGYKGVTASSQPTEHIQD
jgi:CAAX protease family protein